MTPPEHRLDRAACVLIGWLAAALYAGSVEMLAVAFLALVAIALGHWWLGSQP